MNRNTALVAILAGAVVVMLTGFFLRSDDEGELLEVDVEGLVIDPATRTPVVILVGRRNHRALPIFIGDGEAGAIARGLEEIETPRPMTHDLMKSILDGIGARVERVVVTDLQDNVFYAQIVIGVGEETRTIDSRPSDAIALAIRTEAPIFVAGDVMRRSASADLTGWVLEESLTERFGFRVQAVSGELLEALGVEGDAGVLVSDVEAGSSADRGGLVRGDVILRLEGESVAGVEAFHDVLVARGEGDPLAMVVASPSGTRELRLSPGGVEE